MSGRPQQPCGTSRVPMPARSSTSTAATPISGSLYSVKVSAKSTARTVEAGRQSRSRRDKRAGGPRRQRAAAIDAEQRLVHARGPAGSPPPHWRAGASQLPRRAMLRTLPKARTLAGAPCASHRAASTSLLMRAMSTLVGHSLLQARHSRQRSRASMNGRGVEAGGPELATHRQAQHVGPSARRVRLVARGHVGRAHRALARLAAQPDAAAVLDRAPEAAVGAEVEEGHRLRRAVSGAEAQVRGDRRRVDDPSGIEDALRVEGPLHLAERLVERRAEHLLVEGAAHQAVAVLARERAAELEHEIGDIVGDGLELRQALGGLEVDDRPDVQAADRGVRVDAGVRAPPRDHLPEARDVVAQPLGRHRRVLDERDGFGIAFHAHRQAERRLPDVPHPRLGRGVGQVPDQAADASSGQVALERLHARDDLVQVRRRRTPRRAASAGGPMTICRRAASSVGMARGVPEDEGIHHLDGRRPVAEHERRGTERVEQVVELERDERLGRRQRHQADGGRGDEPERALRAHHHAREIHRCGRVDEARRGRSRRPGA